jgi:catechol 2,3-dioxygenase-like lactoylglutathione lyase family enzyme
MTVADMDRSVAFYTSVLQFRRISEVELADTAYEHLESIFGLRMRVVTLGLGDERLVLTQFLVPRGRPFPYDSRANDRWFQHVAIVVSDMERAYARLREHNVEYASTAPQTLPAWNKQAAGIRAFYFRDPDGHYLELIQFPPGKGDPRWQIRNRGLFLGIDHTAIVVNSTDASVAFYRSLGFHVTGGGENYGVEQEHLNNVFGAHLRITALRSPNGPGVELLEYLAPRDGRPAPRDVRPNDIEWWQITLSGGLDQNRTHHAPAANTVSKPWNASAVQLPGRELGFNYAAIVEDPDGHHVELTRQ